MLNCVLTRQIDNRRFRFGVFIKSRSCTLSEVGAPRSIKHEEQRHQNYCGMLDSNISPHSLSSFQFNENNRFAVIFTCCLRSGPLSQRPTSAHSRRIKQFLRRLSWLAATKRIESSLR